MKAFSDLPFKLILMCVFQLTWGSAVSAQDIEKKEAVDIEEIEVFGIRESLRKAIDAKRNADSIIDTLRAEDIGKLPDVTIADSLARLPGVRVERDRGNGSTISVRGLGPDLIQSTLNGREVVTAGASRIPNFQQFPAELINGADVRKTATASHVEGGLAANIDLLSLKPLEVGERAVNLGGRLIQDSVADSLRDVDDFGNRLSVSYIDQFLDETLGVALGYARLDQTSGSVRANTSSFLTSFREFDNGPTTNFGFGRPLATSEEALSRGAFIPAGFEYLARSGEDVRDAGTFALQWAASDSVSVNYDVLYSRSRIEEDQLGYRTGYRLPGIDNQLTFENQFDQAPDDGFLFELDGQSLVAFETLRSPEPGAFNHLNIGSVAERFTREDEFVATGLNVEWAQELLTTKIDIGYSKVSRSDIFASLVASSRAASLLAGQQDIVVLDIRPSVPIHEFNRDLTDLNGNFLDAFEVPDTGGSGANDVRDELFSTRLDFDLFINDTIDLKFGVRVTDRKKSNIAGSQFIDLGDTVIRPEWVRSSILGSYNGDLSDFPEFLSFDLDRVLDDLDIQIDPQLQPSADDLRNTWVIEEDTIALYTQLDFNAELKGMPLFGNVGLRYSKTNQNISGLSQTFASVPSQSNNQEFVLPSLNVTLKLDDQQQIRLALAKAISRAPLDDLRPGVDVFGTSAFGGNPDLKPFESDQVDLSYEIYFDNEAVITFAGFYKELNTYIIDGIEQGVDINGDGTISSDEAKTELARPVNGNGGNVRGVEILYNQPFSFLPQPFDGLGIYATYSYTDGNTELSQSLGGDTIPVTAGLRGLSRHAGVVTLWYSKNWFEASFNYRARSENATLINNSLQIAESEAILDFQTNVQINDNLGFFFQASNLTDERFHTRFATSNQRARNEDFGRFYNVGFKYKIGG
jgi:iron complex outermembrane receptor protein